MKNVLLPSIFRRTSLTKKDEPPRNAAPTKEELLKITAHFPADQTREIGFRLDLEDSRIVVQEVKENSLAADRGIFPGDVLVEVQGKDISKWTIPQCVEVCKNTRPLKLSLLRNPGHLVVGTEPVVETNGYTKVGALPPVSSQGTPNGSPSYATIQISSPVVSNNGMSSDFPSIGVKYDCLHKYPLSEELRCARAVPPSRIPPEPKTGWRWRPCVIISLEEPQANSPTRSRRAKVKFLDIVIGYPAEDIVDLGPGNQNLAPFGLKSPSHIMHHAFRSDDILDVLDIFSSKFDGGVRKKWRKCQVVAVAPYFIRVTFSGWDEAYDLWVHVLEESERLAEFGLHTERQQVEESNREKEFRKKMVEKGFQVIDVSPDGNCLFRSVSVLLFGDETHQAEIREAVCNYMEKDAKRFEFLAEDGDFAGYVKNMRNLAVWGDEPELRVIEELYDRPISMFSCDIVGQNEADDFTEPLAHYKVGEEVAGLQDTEPLRLSFHGNNHYNAVVLKGKAKSPYSAHPEENKQRIRTHRLMQGAGSLSNISNLRTHHSSFSLRRSNSSVSNIGK
jgi:hypothetical protein